jgi:hypothetical protein
MQHKIRNRVGSCPIVKCAERISPRSRLLRCKPPSWSSPYFSMNWARRLGIGRIPSSVLVILGYSLFGSFLCNRRLAIALEVAKPWSALKESRHNQLLRCIPPSFLNEFSYKKKIKKDSESLFQDKSIAATQNLLWSSVQELQAFEVKSLIDCKKCNFSKCIIFSAKWPIYHKNVSWVLHHRDEIICSPYHS